MAKFKLPPDFKEFLRLLNENGVEYLLVGGYAVAYHGYPRTTGDMDIWVGKTPENAGRLVTVLKEFGFDVPNLSPDLFLDERKVVRMGVPPVRIEILTSVSGVSFADCFRNRVVESLEGIPVNIISLNDLKRNKEAAGRYRDLDDLENLP